MATKNLELKLYDTLTREKRVFNPIDPARVRMYVCGPTVYDFAHIGNARPVIVFDVLYRLLRHLYGPEHVAYVRNITDVDDKINARAAERGISIRQLTEETYNNFKSDVAALGCLPPTVEPRATDYVSNPGAPVDMIRLIERLIANGNAYAAEGHVLFAVATMPDYGKLSKRSLDEMMAGARVEVAPYKRDPMDFVLWKPSPPELPGWDSPWGRGRPGWHIECSAMSAALLGETFDIHGGGIDLVFPHHENEIAQSRCAFHTGVMANYWMHNGFLQVEGEKMSKSLGNFFTIRELLEKWPGDVLRLQMLMTHYRQPIDWTKASSTEVSGTIDTWLDAARLSKPAETYAYPTAELVDILSDDLNTPEAVSYLHALAKHAGKNEQDSQSFTNNVVFLGIFRDFRAEVQTKYKGASLELVQALNAVEWLRRTDLDLEKLAEIMKREDEFRKYYNKRRPVSEALRVVDFLLVNKKIEARLAARAVKDFKESDRIRDELGAMGVVLKDSKDGTTWEIAR